MKATQLSAKELKEHFRRAILDFLFATETAFCESQEIHVNHLHVLFEVQTQSIALCSYTQKQDVDS